MNEQDQFRQLTQSFFAAYLERIQGMTETQVLNALRAWESERDSVNQRQAFLNSVSLAPEDDLADEISKLRSLLNSKARPGAGPFDLSEYIEDALKKRLDTLRKNNSGAG